MAKVYGIHDIVLNDGADEASFKKFFKEYAKQMQEVFGWKMSLLKGDRGKRSGEYAVLFEIKNVKERDRFSPAPNQSSEEMDRLYKEHKAMADEMSKKWFEFSPTDTGAHTNYTDYIEVA